MIGKWRDLGKITSEQASLAFATKPYCAKHLADLLDDLQPGTKARIVGDAYKGWERNYHNGYATIERMRRAGLIPKPPKLRPPANRQCIARARSGRRCLQWALRGKSTCRNHGGCGGANKLTPAERQAKAQMRLQRWHDREQRKKASLLPLSTRYKPEPQQRTLEDEFRTVRPKPLKPLY
jgi:hypothetical protein